MRKGSALLLFVAGLAAVAAVAGVTFGVVQVLELDEEDVAVGTGGEGEGPPGRALRRDQVEVTGLATAITVEGAAFDEIPTPLTVTVDQPGQGGATLTDVEVDGTLTDIVWDGGRPFDLQGLGGLVPHELNLFAEPAAITVQFVDGAVNEIVPGSYGLQTPVAVGRGGVAAAREAVPFAATVESTLVFRGGAKTSMLPRALDFQDAGTVVLQGQFELRRPDGAVVEVSGIELPEGAYDLQATPVAGGYEVTALLQGEIRVL